MKKIIALVFLFIGVHLSGDDLVVFDNEYNIVPLEKNVKKVIVGNKDMINVSFLKGEGSSRFLKVFGKKIGTTSILLIYRDGSMQDYHVYINRNLGYIQKMINFVEPSLKLNKAGNGAAVLTGVFKDPHDKKRVFKLLENAGIDANRTMDLTETNKVNKMIRTKLYLVEINNQKAKDLGGITGLGFLDGHTNISLNPTAVNGATFSGWLLDNFGKFSARTGKSITGTLNFLEEKGIGKILDDTVLITTEDQNASFRVGGEVYIPVGITQNAGYAPTINLEEREYGLTLVLTTTFMEKEGYMYIDVNIKDSEFDTNKDHDVQLGTNIFVPSFVSKNINTNVVVKSGQVIALGGRLHSEDIDQEEKVPILGDIPLLGRLFTHTVKSTKGNDLLFFLVPEIVDANEQLDDRRFYRDFSKASFNTHETLLDKSDDQIAEANKEPLAVKNDVDVLQATEEQNTAVIQKQEEAPMVIEEENNTTDDVIEAPQEESNEMIEQQPAEAMPEQSNKTVEEQTTEEQRTSVEEAQVSDLFSVKIKNIYVRSSPSLRNSVIVSVWKEGHKFKATETKIVEGVEWLKINEDCLDTCITIDYDLWISKKYTQLEK